MATIKLIKGDITLSETNVIVNAANSSLLGGGGVDGAIHRKGGPQVLEECIAIRARQGGCITGEAVYTSGGLLSCRYVIHTVGPVWNGGNKKERELLKNCYRNSLQIANKLDVASIAFPNISTGIYRFPKQEAAEIAIYTIHELLKTENKTILEVVFVCFDDENYKIYQHLDL